MNIQTEHLDNHTARLTVEVEQERVQKAMQAAARRISAKANVPGFRKGKAPYNVILRYVGEAALLEEAVEDMGDSVYQEALTQSGIRPYAAAQLENIEMTPTLKLTFSVPESPEVILGDYRETLRVPFTVPEVEDSLVTSTIRETQEERAVIEPAERPAQMGDKVKLEVNGTMIHHHDADHAHEATPDAAEPASPPTDVDETAPPTDETAPPTDETALAVPEAQAEDHEHEEHSDPIQDELDIFLRTEDDFMPGFSEQVVGLSAGEEKSFTLSYPADYAEASLAGHTVNLTVKVNEVRSAALPLLNDDFVKQVTEGEVDNLLDYRIKVRKDLQDALTRYAETQYGDQTLDKLVENTTFKYPEVAIEEYIDEVLRDLDETFRQRGLSLEELMKLEGRSPQEMRGLYRGTAIRRLIRSLALAKLVEAEGLSVTNPEVEAEVDRMAQQFGDQAATFRRMLLQDKNRANVIGDLLKNKAFVRLIAIARGENPPLAAPPAEATAQIIMPEAAEISAGVSEPPAPVVDTPAPDEPAAAGTTPE